VVGSDVQGQYPEVLENLLSEWVGLSEDDTIIYGSSRDNIIDFSADVEKRHAVVEAFKVRVNFGEHSPVFEIC
jgi:hypothetical protein